MRCASPIGIERLVAYWASELAIAEVDAIDEHLFGCDACARDMESVSRIVQGLRGDIPPVITREQVEALRARGHAIRENDFDPGVRKTVVFEHGVELLIHRLRGLPLADADRVEVTVRLESGLTVNVDPYAPFDRERGEVLIACQRHFGDLPDPNVVFDVAVHRGTASTVATFYIPHQFT